MRRHRIHEYDLVQSGPQQYYDFRADAFDPVPRQLVDIIIKISPVSDDSVDELPNKTLIYDLVGHHGIQLDIRVGFGLLDLYERLVCGHAVRVDDDLNVA